MAQTNAHQFGTIPFEERQFAELLSGEQSWRMMHLPATICPCRHRSSGDPDQNCTNCLGYGYTWLEPNLAEHTETFYSGSKKRPPQLDPHLSEDDIIGIIDDHNVTYTDFALEDGLIVFGESAPPIGEAFHVTYRAPETVQGSVTNLVTHREWRELGEIDHRDLHLTIDRMTKSRDNQWRENSAWEAAHHDRFLMPYARINTSDILYRGEREHLTYGFLYRIKRCYSLTPGYNPVDYLEGEHFTIEAGQVTWEEGQGPKKGPYAVIYTAAPQFYVWRELPQLRHQGGKALPRRLMLRTWELYPRPGAQLSRSHA